MAVARKALPGFANTYVRVLLRLGVRDAAAGFKLWRSSALKAINLASIRSNRYSFQVEIARASIPVSAGRPGRSYK
jgi:dolichol-phosphate mannosyltransferase